MGVLIIVPWITDFIIHDFVLAPFLETYVRTLSYVSTAALVMYRSLSNDLLEMRSKREKAQREALC